MNLLLVFIPDIAILLSVGLGVLALALGGVLAYVIVHRKRQKPEKPEQEIVMTAYEKREIVPTEAPEGKLEKTYAPLFADEFRENYDADYYVTKVKEKDIDKSSDVYKVDEKRVAAELKRVARQQAKQAQAKQEQAQATTSQPAGTTAQGAGTTTTTEATQSTTKAGSTATPTAQPTTAQATAKGAGYTLDTAEPAEVDRSKDKVLSYDGDNAIVIRGNSLFHIQYLKSYSAKLIQAEIEQKKYYSDLKNELLAYGLKPRTSWRAESFRRGRKKFAVLVMRGKTMCLLLALDPKKYANTKYKVEDVSDVGWLKEVPCLYRLKNPRRVKYATELIGEALKELSRQEKEYIDYSAIPEATVSELVAKRLIKLVEHIQPVTPTEANVAMTDEIAKAHIVEGDLSDRRKVEIINIDDLSENFETGETVTLAEVKKRIKGFNRKATALKVLARGSLDKALTVEADDFSLEAVKMIVLTGGKVIKKRRNA